MKSVVLKQTVSRESSQCHHWVVSHCLVTVPRVLMGCSEAPPARGDEGTWPCEHTEGSEPNFLSFSATCKVPVCAEPQQRKLFDFFAF